jgi:hypothetical protein
MTLCALPAGNFIIHVYHKWRLAIEVPDLSESCQVQ